MQRLNQKVQLKCERRSQFVYADKQYARMAIENLVSNASKYSYEKSRIIITTRAEKNKFYLSVTDEGVGIAEGDIPKLFNKFSRIDNKLSVKAGGSGIGLYLSKQVARLHNGDIVVISKIGKGSTFTLILPIKKGSS
jgi:two-component system sensor histidine kinase SenX3